jgi:hypothetical protein
LLISRVGHILVQLNVNLDLEMQLFEKYCIQNLQANQSTIVVATHKEVLELDISKILQPPAFLKDETEYDIEVIRK